MRLRFAQRTVPALRLDGGEKVQGSRAILRRLDELVPEPPLLPADPAARDAVLRRSGATSCCSHSRAAPYGRR
ncbi:hypothetical protein BH20ACT17_BH20ACT17_03100 [soil metagenome]